MLFRMVPKRVETYKRWFGCFRAMLFRMVPKRVETYKRWFGCFRAMLFRMVPKRHEAPHSQINPILKKKVGF